MSTSATKRTLAQAISDAKALRELIGADLAARWQLAGSTRRRVAAVGDIEHVVIPRFGDVPGKDLFATPRRANLLFERLDRLAESGEITKAPYGASEGFRWGEKLRGILFRGFKHEFFTADADNWGSVFAIRTGPAEFSHRLVILLQKQGYWNDGGYVWNKRDLSCPCGWKGTSAGYSDAPAPADVKYVNGEGRWLFCPGCKSAASIQMARVSVPEETDYLTLCGMKFVEPERRR